MFLVDENFQEFYDLERVLEIILSRQIIKRINHKKTNVDE